MASGPVGIAIFISCSDCPLSAFFSLPPTDATDLSSIKECAQQVGSLVGDTGLNLLVNNAGVLCKATLQESTAEDMRSSFDTNVVGPMHVIKVGKKVTL